MSFRIFAAGSTLRGGPFNQTRSGLDIGDIYDAAAALSAIVSVPTSARVALDGVGAAVGSVVEDEIVDRATVTSPHQQSVTAMGQLVGAHLFATNLTLLVATCAPLILFVAVRGSAGLLTGAPTGTAQLRFTGGEAAPATDLFRRLNPVLDRCEMNGFGVLSALARVFADYSAAGGRGADGQYRLNIDVTAT
jgi:hypothetical protein